MRRSSFFRFIPVFRPFEHPFAGFGLYDSLTATTSMLVVVAVWVILLAFCTLWMGRFEMGPVERLWRWLTYGPATKHR